MKAWNLIKFEKKPGERNRKNQSITSNKRMLKKKKNSNKELDMLKSKNKETRTMPIDVAKWANNFVCFFKLLKVHWKKN